MRTSLSGLPSVCSIPFSSLLLVLRLTTSVLAICVYLCMFICGDEMGTLSQDQIHETNCIGRISAHLLELFLLYYDIVDICASELEWHPRTLRPPLRLRTAARLFGFTTKTMGAINGRCRLCANLDRSRGRKQTIHTVFRSWISCSRITAPLWS